MHFCTKRKKTADTTNAYGGKQKYDTETTHANKPQPCMYSSPGLYFKPGYFRIYGNTNKDDNELLMWTT